MPFEFQPELENLNEVPETLKGLYSEKEGKFFLVDDLKKKLDTGPLKQAYEREKGEAKKFKDAVKAFEALGKSPEEIADILKDFDTRSTADAEKKGEWEKLKGQMTEKHQQQLTALENEKGTLRKKLENYLVDAEAARQIADLKGNGTVLLPHVKASTKVVEENGDFVVRVVDSKGDPRVDGQGNFLTIKDLVAEMKASEVFGCAFLGSGANGGGTPPNGGQGGGGQGDLKRATMTPKEKSAYIDKHGQEAYLKLPEK